MDLSLKVWKIAKTVVQKRRLQVRVLFWMLPWAKRIDAEGARLTNLCHFLLHFFVPRRSSNRRTRSRGAARGRSVRPAARPTSGALALLQTCRRQRPRVHLGKAPEARSNNHSKLNHGGDSKEFRPTANARDTERSWRAAVEMNQRPAR